MEAQLKTLLKTIKEKESQFSMLLGLLVIVLIGSMLFRSGSQDQPDQMEGDEPAAMDLSIDEEIAVDEPEIAQEDIVPTESLVTEESEMMVDSDLSDTSEPEERETWLSGLARQLREWFTGEEVIEDEEVIVEDDYSLEISESEDGSLLAKGLPTTHRVLAGETLWLIAEKYYGSGFNYVDIVSENELVNPNMLETDQVLEIPQVPVRIPVDPGLRAKVMERASDAVITQPKMVESYTIREGDTLWSIADSVMGDGYAWVRLHEANRELITDPNLIESGWVLQIPR